MAENSIQLAANELSRVLQAKPLSREAWLQFIFEGDATQFPSNFSASSDGNLGIGASSHAGRLSMDGVPYIELQCDAETFLQVVYGRLPLEHALSSGKLIVKGGHDIAGGEPVGGKADTVRETLIRELASRFTREVSSDCT